MTREIKIQDYIRVIVKWRRIIIFNVGVITLLAIIISLVLPKKYTATTSLLPPMSSQEGLGLQIPGVLAGMAGVAGVMGMGATPSDLFAAVLKSKTVMKGVIEDHNLMEVYKQKTMTETYEKLEKNTDIEVSPEAIITIATTAKTPELARDMAVSYVKNLDKINKSMVMSIGKRNRMFLGKRIAEVKKDLKSTEESLRSFQERHKTLSIEDELIPVLKSVGDIKAQIVARRVELGILQQYATEENPEIIRVKSELKELNAQLTNMEQEGDSKHFGIGFSVPFKKVPEVGLELARLTREVMIQNGVYKLLTEQYERAKIQEVKDTPTVDVLEEATIPELRSFPIRRKIVIVAFIMSLFVGVVLAFFFEHIERLEPEERKRWQEIGKMMRRKKVS